MVNLFTKDNLPEIGQTVIDEQGDIGIVIEASDYHNIVVEYEEGGIGLYCLDPKCIDEYTPLTSLDCAV